MYFGHLRRLSIAILFLGLEVANGYSPTARWGQASLIIDDKLYVHGGMVDPDNSHSYTASSTTNDLLLLSLSSPFSAESPPWELVSSSSNSSTSQGPSLAWHTLSATNTSSGLLFGGIPDANSPPPLVTRPDSAWILDIFNRLEPQWNQQEGSWASEPIRRIHHTCVSAKDGKVYLIGGEKADGSDSAFAEHYIFNPEGPSFTQLPTENGPPAITGHATVILSNGLILVFGGSSRGSLLPFSTIWALDTTQDSLAWTTVSVSSDSLPRPRRAFAVAVLPGDFVLIQGGSDDSGQTVYNDGWILNTSATPMTWTNVDALSEVGARRDHFAVPYAGQVIFGFGYGTSGPAGADIIVYDTGISDNSGGSNGSDSGNNDNDSDDGDNSNGSPENGNGNGNDGASGTIAPTFTPAPTGSTPTRTVPGPSQTDNPNEPSGSGSGVNPTSTSDPGDDGSPANNDNKSNNKKTTAIAVGTAFAILAFLLAFVFVAWYIRRKRRFGGVDNRFLPLNAGDDDNGGLGDSPQDAVPLAGAAAFSEKPRSPVNVLKNLAIAGPLKLVAAGTRRVPERRDMLADEDSRDFGFWYDRRRREGTGGSSWSLKSILGGLRSREASMTSVTPWREKSDPFSDGATLMRDEETGFVGAAVPGPSRPRGGRQMSYASSYSGLSYTDPFADPLFRDDEEQVYRNVGDHGSDSDNLELLHPSRNTGPSLHLNTMLPLTDTPHVLSPVIEATSRNTQSFSDMSSQGGHSSSSHGLASPGIASSSQSHDPSATPFDSLSAATSRTSYEMLRSPRTSSIIDQPKPTQPVRRSDSWWARFSRTSLLDRRMSDSASRRRGNAMDEFRDPNPPPRLGAIEESQHSGSPETDKDSPGSQRANSIQRGQAALARAGSKIFGTHGRSVSSFRTANSDALERVGQMDVAVRERTGSNRTRESTATNLSVDTDEGRWLPEREPEMTVSSPTDMYVEAAAPTSHQDKTPSPTWTPPFAQTPSASAGSSSTSLGSGKSVRPPSGASVASKVKDYERRMSQDLAQPSLTNTKHREERSRKQSRVDYGLVPRPSLFVANPDHRAMPSND